MAIGLIHGTEMRCQCAKQHAPAVFDRRRLNRTVPSCLGDRMEGGVKCVCLDIVDHNPLACSQNSPAGRVICRRDLPEEIKKLLFEPAMRFDLQLTLGDIQGSDSAHIGSQQLDCTREDLTESLGQVALEPKSRTYLMQARQHGALLYQLPFAMAKGFLRLLALV